MNNILVHLVHCFSYIVFAKGHLKEEVYLMCQLLEVELPFKDTCSTSRLKEYCLLKRTIVTIHSLTAPFSQTQSIHLLPPLFEKGVIDKVSKLQV